MKFVRFVHGISGLLPLASALLIGCTHLEKQVSASANYQYEMEKALGEAAIHQDARNMILRAPAAGDADITQLERVSPGKFKIYVFPKLQSKAEKNMLDVGPLFTNEADERFSRLGLPEEYEVSTVASSPCYQFITGNLFAALGVKDYFDSRLAEDKTRHCVILEVTSMKIKNANRALIRRDDLLRMRLFLDDAYVLNGYELEKYVDGQNIRVTRVKSERGEGAASALTYFPVDIPTLAIRGGPSSTRGPVESASRIDRMALKQVRNKFMKSFEARSCLGAVSRYRDYFGSQVEVGWCDGLPFPQYMENSRFVAITQPLSVR